MTGQRIPAVRITAAPKDASANGTIFGGWLMAMMDSGAGLTATRGAGGRVTTVAVDGMHFLQPVEVGDVVSVYGEVVRIGRTSLTVSAELTRSDRFGGAETKAVEAVFTFVAIGDDGRPRPVTKE